MLDVLPHALRLLAEAPTTTDPPPTAVARPAPGVESAAVLRLVLPKGSLEKATLELFEAADLERHALLRRRVQGHDRRPPSRRGPGAAPAGDPGLRRRGAVRRGHHRSGLDRGDVQRRRQPRRAALLEGDDEPDPHGGRRGRRLGRAGGRRSQGRRAGLDRVPRADQALLRRRGIDADVRLSYGASEAKIPDIADCVVEITETGRALRAAGLRIIDTILVSYTEVDRQPGSPTRTRTSATPWAS